MAYTGTTHVVDCTGGGLTGVKISGENLPPSSMVYPTRNLVYEKGGRRKRGGTAHLYAAAFTGTPKILGVFDCTFQSLTQYVITATDDGDVFKNDQDTIATGLGTTLPYCFTMGENKLFIADGVNEPLAWTGTGNAAQVSEPATDWATSPPFQLLVHGRGASQRMCALNKNTLYLSKSYAAAGDMEKFVTSAVSLYMDTGDGIGLTGMAEIGDEVIVFGKRKAYRLDDTSTSTADWGFQPAQWNGGAANWRLIVPIPSGDVICMMEDGDVYSVTSAAEYGDYKAASLMGPSMMHEYVKQYINLSKIANFHGVYYPPWRAVIFFVTKAGNTNNDMALIYFTDRSPGEAWMVHDNADYASGYNASASAVLRDFTNGSFKLYTGDYSGEMWKLDQTDRNDNSNGFYGGFTTFYNSFGNPRVNKHFNSIDLVIEPKGEFELTVNSYVDGDSNIGSVSMQAGGTVSLGTFILDADVLGGDKLQDARLLLGYIGRRIQYEIYNSVANEDFFITEFMTDFKPKGIRQS